VRQPGGGGQGRALSELGPVAMGRQVPRCLCPPAAPPPAVWADPPAGGRDLSCAGPPARGPARRRARVARPRPQVQRDPAHVCRRPGERLLAGPARHGAGPASRGQGAHLHGRAVLGAGGCGVHGRGRTGRGAGVPPQTGGGGPRRCGDMLSSPAGPPIITNSGDRLCGGPTHQAPGFALIITHISAVFVDAGKR
jgi:hypothetical protein